jgi:hypothetical protein
MASLLARIGPKDVYVMSMNVIDPQGKGWPTTSLRKMLANEVYTGTIRMGTSL